MIDDKDGAAGILVAPLPEGPGARLALFAMRRMATAGIGDAHAASAYLGAFGVGFRRPLVLTRALVAEVARATRRQITVAPCCCHRITADERALLGALRESAVPHGQRLLASLLGSADWLGVAATADAVARAFADLGQPIGRTCAPD